MSRRFIRTAFVILFVALFAGVGLAAYSNLFVSQLQVRDLLVYFSAQALFCFLLVLTIRYLIMAVVVNPKAETREKRHNGAERCLPNLSRINRRRKWVALANMTRASVRQQWNG